MRRSPLVLLPALLFAVLPVGSADPPKADPAAGRIPPRSPAESLKAFQVASGFKVELVAAEPLVQSPVACDFDEDGRLYVAELPEYNAYAATRPHGQGRVVRLDDTDGDGVMDRRTVLAEGINYPTGLICWDGGVYVGAAPDLLYLKDTDGNGSADVRRVILSGFGQDRAGEGQLNSFRWTLENRILVSTGSDGGELKAPDGKSVSLRSTNVLLDPKTNAWEPTSGGGQHGMTLDDWGRVFVSGNSDPIQHLAYDARYLSRTPDVPAPPAAVNVLPSGKFTRLNRISEVEPWRILRTRLRKEKKIPGPDEGGSPSGFFTGATGVTAYRGDAFPPEFRGDLFVGEVANNLVFRAKLKQDGSLPLAERADPDREFLASKDVWFRPVQFANAPDGCLYVLDMYRELIEGAAFLAPEVLKLVDPSAGVDRGRIWRIAPENFKRPAPPKLGNATTAELVALLDHPNGWYRDTASRLLYQKQDPNAVKPLLALAETAKTPQGRLHALYALAGRKKLDLNVIRKALRDPEPRVREHAIRLCETRFGELKPPPYRELWDLRADADPNVRIQLAYSLHRVDPADQGNEAVDLNSGLVYVQLAIRDARDPWMRLALLAGIDPPKMWRVMYGSGGNGLAGSQFFRSQPDGKAFLVACAAVMAADPNGSQAQHLVQVISDLAYGTRGSRADPTLARTILRTAITRGSVQTQAYFNDPENGSNFATVRDALVADAVRTARDTRRPVEVRAAAVRDLEVLPFRDALPVLKETLQSAEPPAVQTATLDVLGKFTDDAVPALILDAWKAMTPQVRATATEVLLGRSNGVVAFLDAVEAGRVARGDVDPARVALLKKSKARNIGPRAARLFAAPPDRQKVFEAYRPALERRGDPAKGKAVFKAHCAACHKLEEVGEEVGADLKAIRDRGLDGVLLGILDPNREVKPQFLSYSAELKSGRVVTGLVTAETATGLTIRRADGQSEVIPRSDVEALRSLGVSYMPEGLEKQIDMPAMADLLAYLNSIR